MELGKAIKNCRNQRNLSQKELAKKAKMSISYLSLLERDKREANIHIIKNIAHALDIPLSVLIFLASDKKELSGLDETLINKISRVALELMETK